MNLEKQRFFPYDQLHHRTILLYGFHFSFAFIFFLAPIRDIIFGNYFNLFINSTAFFVVLWSYYQLNYKKRIALATFLILAVALVPLYILIYYNSFANLVVVYVILLPLAAFFLLDFKPAMATVFAIYLSLAGLLYMIALKNPLEPTLHNPLALINIAFASILIMSFGLIYHFSIFLQMQKLVKNNTQKDILLKEVHHRVKNNLNVTASMLGLQALKADPFTAEALKKSKARIEAISTVHEMLYKEEDFENIVFNHYVERLKESVMSIYGTHENIQFHFDGDETLSVHLDKMVQIGLIINELITNSIKHTNSGVAVDIHISMEKEDGRYRFVYFEDSDKVVDEKTLTESDGLGVKLIHLSAKQIDATLHIETQTGVKYIIEFDDV